MSVQITFDIVGTAHPKIVGIFNRRDLRYRSYIILYRFVNNCEEFPVDLRSEDSLHVFPRTWNLYFRGKQLFDESETISDDFIDKIIDEVIDVVLVPRFHTNGIMHQLSMSGNNSAPKMPGFFRTVYNRYL